MISLAMVATVLSCENEPVEASSQSELKTQISLDAHVGNSVFVSSNNSGKLSSFNIGTGLDNPSLRTFDVPYADADGIVYDGNRNALYHVNRSMSKLVAYSDISTYVDGDAITPSAMGPSTFTAGREASMYNNKVIVVDQINPGRLVSYHVNTDNISQYREYTVDFQVWAVQAVGKDLYAIEDLDNKLAYFEDFHKLKSGDIDPTIEVSIEGLVRTHGLNYDEHADVMVLTDIGIAANDPNAATDGALVIIENFRSKLMAAGDGGTISLADQIRIEGSNTELGNPVDVNISAEKGAIFVAERASQGGKFLIFSYPSMSGNIAPVSSTLVMGASAVERDFH